MDEETREILFAALAGEASRKQLEALAHWRSNSAENEQEYQRVLRMWTASEDLPASPVERARPAARAVVDSAEARVRGERAGVGSSVAPRASGSASGSVRRFRFARVAAVAAALVVGFGLGSLLTQWQADGPLGPRFLVTGPGQMATATLHDGTVVQLAPDSRLEFADQEPASEVRLEGRAYFAVPSRTDRAFRVVLPGGDVEVLGTRFDVQGRNGQMQVAVVEGAVRLIVPGGEVQVGVSQVARSSDSAPPTVEDVDDVYSVINWLGGFLAFQATPLTEVADELERRLGIVIEIEDSALRDRTVTGWFTEQRPEAVIAGICGAVSALCTVDADQTVRMELPSGNDVQN